MRIKSLLLLEPILVVNIEDYPLYNAGKGCVKTLKVDFVYINGLRLAKGEKKTFNRNKL